MGLKLFKLIYNSFNNTTPLPVMKITLAVSLLSHILIFSGMQTFYPVFWEKKELKTYRVDLMRMEIEDLPEGSVSDTLLENTKGNDRPLAEDTQDTISLDTKDERYVSYMSAIKNEIMNNWRYPPEGRAYLLEGSSIVLFSIVREGAITGISITRSSGHEVLDNEVIRAIKKCDPFPPFPSSIRVNKLNINGSFEYRLTSSVNNQ